MEISKREQQIRDLQAAIEAFTGTVRAAQAKMAARPKKLRRGEALRQIFRAGYEGGMAEKAGKGGEV